MEAGYFIQSLLFNSYAFLPLYSIQQSGGHIARMLAVQCNEKTCNLLNKLTNESDNYSDKTISLNEIKNAFKGNTWLLKPDLIKNGTKGTNGFI